VTGRGGPPPIVTRMAHRCFDLDITDRVAHLRLIRPDELNTMVPEFWRELPALVAEVSDSGAARVLVLSSTGRHFSAGMDLAVFGGQHAGEPELETGRRNAYLRENVLALQGAISVLESARMPVLAAIQGGCVGGAVDLVCAADLRYASAEAFFCVQETNLAMTADVGTLQRLPSLVPLGIAREMAYLGRRLPAQRAYEVGLVNEVFPDPAALLAGVSELAREIAEKSPLALYGAKVALTYARDHSVPDSLEQVAAWQAGMFQPADMLESFTAKSENRPPRYGDLAPRARGL
jgi:enoyl-CoA hydratase